MEDAQEVQEKTSEAILNDASEAKHETRDETLSRHRYLFSYSSLVWLVLHLPWNGTILGFLLFNEIKIGSIIEFNNPTHKLGL